MKSHTLIELRKRENLKPLALTYNHHNTDVDALMTSTMRCGVTSIDPDMKFTHAKHLISEIINFHSLQFLLPTLHHDHANFFTNGYASIDAPHLTTCNDRMHSIHPFLGEISDDPIYNAPENYVLTHSNGNYNFYHHYKKSDIWRLGVIIFYLLTHEVPFKEWNEPDLQKENQLRSEILNRLGNSIYIEETVNHENFQRKLFFENEIIKHRGKISDQDLVFFINLLTDMLDPCIQTRLNSFEINTKYNLFPELMSSNAYPLPPTRNYPYLIKGMLDFCHQVFFIPDEYHKAFVDDYLYTRVKSDLNILNKSSSTYFYDLCSIAFQTYIEGLEHFDPMVRMNIKHWVKENNDDVNIKKIVESYL